MPELSPQIRVVYYRGAVTALTRQRDRIALDLATAEAELEQALRECKTPHPEAS